MRKPIIAVAVLALAAAALLAGRALAGDAACCQLTTSLTQDVFRGQDLNGDERFFISDGAPPNIHFLIDNSASMNELVQFPALVAEMAANGTAAKECNSVTLNSQETANGWNPATAYPVPDTGTGLGSDNGFPSLFQGTKYYYFEQWEDSSSPPALTQTTPAAVCNGFLGFATTSTDYTTCQACLNTKGYYIHKSASANYMDYYSGTTDQKRMVFTGNYLNFNPPKYVTERVVLKNVIATLRRMRAGYTIFDTGNGAWGGALSQGQNPSCDQILKDASSFDSNRASYVNGINGISFSSFTPLADTLLNIGQYFSSSDSVYTTKFGFPSTALKNAFRNGSLNSQGRSVCWGCQLSNVVIITDGMSNADGHIPVAKISTANGGPVTVAGCTESSGNCYLDDVAKFLANQDLQQNTPPIVGDLNTAGKQSLTIYTVGFGIDSPILQNTAAVGGGAYYTPTDRASLESALRDILNSINTRATSFSAASVASFEINRSGGSLLPRFKPDKNLTNPREGFLYRFDLASERVLGCDPTLAATLLDGGIGDPNDLNQNGSCNDVDLIDSNNKAVIEDSDGVFVLMSNPTTAATPYWEAGSKLKAMGVPAWQARHIWTIVDSNGDGKIDASDTPLEFTEANAATLMPYLGIANTPTACGDLAAALGISTTVPPAAPQMDPLECARIVIRWYRGADQMNSDPAKRLNDQPYLLHDIFHSAPVSVDPPVDKNFCGLGNQCIETLYGTKTPLQNGYGTPPNTHDAYDEYVARDSHRSKVVLVGSNGGMLHAFHNGAYTGTDPATSLPIYNAGTGNELWAIVPPDMLPKMKPNIGKHAYFVDSGPMVREVWIDGAGGAARDGQKQPEEFRTVAVTGSGLGGVHRFALDLTGLLGAVDGDLRAPSQRGDFLWMWPQPCDELAMKVGESQSNFSPKPPPIGAVAIADASGPITVNGAKAHEQWMVFLQGGYDRYLSRGRGMAMVDIGTGATLWSFFFGDGSTNASKLRFPIAAGVAMVDIGQGATTAQDFDLLFDTATVGDYGGQMWTVRFWQPGTQDPVTGKVTNWYAARSLQVSATGVNAGDQETAAAADGKFEDPFVQVTSNTLDPINGALRTYAGSGDRFNLTDAGGPHCRLSNLSACARLGCQVNPVTVSITRNGISAVAHSYSTTLTTGTYSTSTITTGAQTPACGVSSAKLTWMLNPGGACTASSIKDAANNSPPQLLRTFDSATGAITADDDWVKLDVKAATAPENRARYYGFNSYGPSSAGMFNDAAGAATFDAARLSDAVLTDVTDTATNGTTITGSVAAPGSNGWMVRYNGADERTGSGTALVGGCVLWNSFAPGSAGAVCSATGTNTAGMYQSNALSGVPDCAASLGYSRHVDRSVVAVPGDPAPQVLMAGGVASTTVVTLEAGNTQGNTVEQNKEVLQSVYQLNVDRQQHACRHENSAGACK